MLDGQVQCPLGHSDIVHAVAQAPVGQAVLAHVEAVALAAEKVLGRHHQVLDLDLGVAAAKDVRQRDSRSPWSRYRARCDSRGWAARR